MNKLVFVCLALLLALTAKAQVSGGISFNDDGLNSFYLAIGQTYSVPEREVIIIRERQIPDDEIPVVFFIASRARVGRDEICGLRLAGRSWMDIILFYHLDPAIFYLEIDGDPGPEYGRAYGHWKRPRREWSQIRFEDDDVIKLVNLRFVSKHYQVRPQEVIRLRGEHGSFTKVVRRVDSDDYRSHRGRNDNQEDRRDDKKGDNHGKGKKGKGH